MSQPPMPAVRTLIVLACLAAAVSTVSCSSSHAPADPSTSTTPTDAGRSGTEPANDAGVPSSTAGDANASASAVATPTFTPLAGPFYAATAVTITSATPGAAIYYTTDGGAPSETTGTLYTAPVIMEPPVNTDVDASLLTNASGVTMLKAAAFANGAASQTVTGNYVILDPLRYPRTSSLLLGLAHVAYNVSSTNWSSVLGLWTSYLGFAIVTQTSGFALIKINDQQFIELYQGAMISPQFQLRNWGFYVSDAEAFRQQLAAAGVTVPPSATVNPLGNLSFVTTDPDGHQDEWLQYLSNSVTSQTLGQFMPGTQLFGYVDDYGDCTADIATADAFYNKCGIPGSGEKVYLPNANCYLEMLTYATLSQTEVGMHEKAQLVNFRGSTLQDSLAVLTARDPSIAITQSTEGGSGGFPLHDCADIYDADLSRIRMIDINY